MKYFRKPVLAIALCALITGIFSPALLQALVEQQPSHGGAVWYIDLGGSTPSTSFSSTGRL